MADATNDNSGMLRKVLGWIGPGLVTASVVLGPGSITISSKSGALFGYSILWVVIAAGIMMVVYTRLGATIGMVSDQSFLTLVASRYGRWVAMLIGISGFLICTGFQTGNNIGVGLAMEAIFPGSMALWAAVFTVLALLLMWTSSSLYKLLERTMVVLVGLMMCCFLGNLFMVRPDAGGLLNGFVPSVPTPENIGLMIAISATTFSVAAAAFQPYLVQSKGWVRADYLKGRRDATVGITLLALISCVIMITSAAVLKPAGIQVTSAVAMAKQLEPLLGSAAKWLFLVGLWAGAFSSFIVNALIGGTLLADGLGLGSSLESFWAKALASGVMVLGTLMALAFGENPVELLVMAQATTILGVPLIAGTMVLLGDDEKLLGDLKANMVARIVALLAVPWLLFLSWSQICKLVAKVM